MFPGGRRDMKLKRDLIGAFARVLGPDVHRHRQIDGRLGDRREDLRRARDLERQILDILADQSHRRNALRLHVIGGRRGVFAHVSLRLETTAWRGRALELTNYHGWAIGHKHQPVLRDFPQGHGWCFVTGEARHAGPVKDVTAREGRPYY